MKFDDWFIYMKHQQIQLSTSPSPFWLKFSAPLRFLCSNWSLGLSEPEFLNCKVKGLSNSTILCMHVLWINPIGMEQWCFTKVFLGSRSLKAELNILQLSTENSMPLSNDPSPSVGQWNHRQRVVKVSRVVK